jgi:hypothetical protein
VCVLALVGPQHYIHAWQAYRISSPYSFQKPSVDDVPPSSSLTFSFVQE